MLSRREAHGGDLLLLRNDNLLSDTLELCVSAVPQFPFGHLDGALMMWDNRRDKIVVDVSRRLDVHPSIILDIAVLTAVVKGPSFGVAASGTMAPPGGEREHEYQQSRSSVTCSSRS